MTLAEFLDAQINTRGWSRMDLYRKLAEYKPDSYTSTSRVYAWWNGGMSKESAADVAHVFDLDADARRVFAAAAGFGWVLDFISDPPNRAA